MDGLFMPTLVLCGETTIISSAVNGKERNPANLLHSSGSKSLTERGKGQQAMHLQEFAGVKSKGAFSPATTSLKDIATSYK